MFAKYVLGEPKLIEKAYGEKYELCRIPGMVMTEKKTLICYYEARESFRDWGMIDVKVIRSADGGESFSDVLTVESSGDTINNPVMISDGDTVHFLYFCNYKRLFYSKSTDDGMSFSEPIEITEVLSSDGTPYTVAATGPGHGIVHDGRIIIPLWYGYDPNDEKSHRSTNIRTLYSEDGGESWKLGETVGKDFLVNANESAIAVTPDGRIIMSTRHRTETGIKRAVSISPDGISGWSTPVLMDTLPDPRCMGSMTHDERFVYHINCASTTDREDLTVKVSRDDFSSYDSIYVSKYAGYSDIAVCGDEMFVFYERFHEKFHKKSTIETFRDEDDGLYFVKIKFKC